MLAEIVDATRRVFGKQKPTQLPRAVDPVIADVVKPEPIHDLAELVADMLRDPMVVMTLGVLLASIKRADVTIKLDTPEGDATAETIVSDIQRLWLETLEKLTDPRNGALTWGGLPFEIVTDNTDVDGVPISRIKTLKQLPKWVNGTRATEYVLAPDGSFGGIRVTIGGSDFIIPAEQAAWFAIGATPLEPHGHSVFFGAPQDVRKRRKKTDGLIDVFVGRWAIDGPVIHAPSLAWDEELQKNVANHPRIAEAYIAGKTAGGLTVLPNEAHDGVGMEGKYAIDVTHETRALDAKPIEVIDNLIDAKMSRAFGVHESVTMDSETGSYASQTVRMFVVLSQCDSYVSQLTTCFRSVVERVYLRANYGDSAPTLTVMPVSLVTDGFLIETVKAILAMPQWGPLLESGAIDVATILANAGIPLARDYVERIDAAFEAVRVAKELAAKQAAEIHASTMNPPDDAEAVKKKRATQSVSRLMQ